MATWKRLVWGILFLSIIPCRGDEPIKPAPTAEEAVKVDEEVPPKSARSKITAVTVYQGNALVSREVNVPEGKGLVELVVTPLPPETTPNSLYTEGTDGLRVLSTRFRAER